MVGASTNRPDFGNMFLEFYRATGSRWSPCTPTAREIAGVPSCPPWPPPSRLRAGRRPRRPVRRGRTAGDGRTGFVQVMSGGFGEAGRAELEDGLVAAAREAGTRLLGPNCMGVYSPARAARRSSAAGPARRAVALISQSGGLAGEVIKVGERRGLAFSRVVTVGNAADVTPAELLRWLSADPHTTAVGIYLEDPARRPRPVRGADGDPRRVAGGPADRRPDPPGTSGRPPRTPAAWSATPGSGRPSPSRPAPPSSPARTTSSASCSLRVAPGPPDDDRRRGAGDRPERRRERTGRRRLRRGGVVLAPLPDGVAGLNPLEIPVGPRARPELVRDRQGDRAAPSVRRCDRACERAELLHLWDAGRTAVRLRAVRWPTSQARSRGPGSRW